MKLNKNIRKTPQGVTLIELSVVIAVILTLLSVLFVGATYYKDAADKAACTISQNAIAKASDAYINLEEPDAAAITAMTFSTLTASGGPLQDSTPLCPTGGAYTLTASASGSSASCADH